jgi:hypothetical protein
VPSSRAEAELDVQAALERVQAFFFESRRELLDVCAAPS